MRPGSTRVFAYSGSEVVVLGLRRRPTRDLYNWLITGPWARLLVLYAVVYFGTQALCAIVRVFLLTRVPGGEALAAVLQAPSDPDLRISMRALAAGALGAVEEFVHWVELGIAAGLMVNKFALARARILFSDVAVIAPHGAGTAFMFRMANERTSHIVDAKVSVMLVRNEVVEGELVRKAHDLDLARRGSALFSHAWTAIHPITRASPVWGESAESLQGAEAEVIVNLSGFDEGLVKTVHARHVYPASRIRWNSRFREIVKVLPDGRHAVDYRKFHKVTAVDEVPQTPPERTPARKAR
jgi:inward rectifier potassium channel